MQTALMTLTGMALIGAAGWFIGTAQRTFGDHRVRLWGSLLGGALLLCLLLMAMSQADRWTKVQDRIQMDQAREQVRPAKNGGWDVRFADR